MIEKEEYKHKITLTKRWDVYRAKKEKLEAYKRFLLRKRDRAKLLSTYTLTHGIFYIMFRKFKDLKEVRFRQFAEKYYGGILKKKVR